MAKRTLDYECYGCRAMVHHDLAKGHVPTGWAMIKLHGMPQAFCSACEVHFHDYRGVEHPGDISPTMRKMLLQRHGLHLD